MKNKVLFVLMLATIVLTSACIDTKIEPSKVILQMPYNVSNCSVEGNDIFCIGENQCTPLEENETHICIFGLSREPLIYELNGILTNLVVLEDVIFSSNEKIIVWISAFYWKEKKECVKMTKAGSCPDIWIEYITLIQLDGTNITLERCNIPNSFQTS